MTNIMKVKFLLCFLLPLFCANLVANTITVSNNANSPGQFTNIQSAINDAGTMAGDIILVQGSPTTYPDFTISKSVKIYGAGVYPATPSGTRSVINYITIAANNVTVSGIHGIGITVNTGITGSRIEYISMNGNSTINGGNSLVLNNRFSILTISTAASNTLILNNVLGGLYGNGTVFTNVIVKNNIFRRGSDASTGVNYNYYGDVAFINFGTSAGMQIWDNIFYKSNLGTIGTSTFSNNIFTTIITSAVSANGNTNVSNTYGMIQPNGNNFDGSESEPANYNLGASTGATVTASDGTQVGVNGGNITFAMKGEAPIPYIRNVFNVTPVIVPSGGTLNVTVTATNGNQ
jgi:hypothetical protein